MSTVPGIGRLGNRIIRNLAVSFIAQKHDLKVNYVNKELIEQLGLSLFSGTNAFSKTVLLNNDNFFQMYQAETLTTNVNPNDYFQTRPITNLIYQYLRTEPVQRSIIEHNPFKEQYSTNNDAFVHVRLGDVIRYNPGADYYIGVLKTLNFDKLYISTDSRNHPIIQAIKEAYPKAIMYSEDEITTFQFASTCKHIVLSHGSFSAVIGYLAFFSTVHYPEYDPTKKWYGDMFSIPGWIQHSILR